jgi:hypothetical protein
MGVAHDGQQRVEEQCDHRRQQADAADQRDEECEQRDRRHGLQHADGTEHQRRAGRPAPGGDAEGHADRDRDHEGAEHERQVLAGESREVVGKQALREAGPRRRGRVRGPACDEALRGLGEARAVQLDLRVERDHRRLVDAAGKLRERRGVEARAHQEDRIVLGKEAAVVDEHAQLVAADLRVGGVDVDEVDTLGGDRVVRDAVVDAGRRRIRQSVRRLERGPAVGTRQELVRQARTQRRRLRPGQVRDAPDAEALGLRLAHRQRIRVVEAERNCDLEPARREPRVEARRAGDCLRA